MSAAVLDDRKVLDSTAAPVPGAARLDSIDLVRGLVMVLMALDHVRDYFSELRFDPTDLSQTYPALFATRWITHFCAPTFILLAGVSARLVAKRREPGALMRFLFTRGIWLVFLEFTLVNFVWTFDPAYRFGLGAQVIWAIGVSMIVLAVLVRLPVAAVGAIGLLMIASHNAFDAIEPQMLGAWAPLWTILHVQGPTPFMFVAYPLVPWIGVMAAGYALGAVYDFPDERRRRALLAMGLVAIAGFVVLRGFIGYGDLRPWTSQPSATATVMAFMNVTKYPPSLAYLLATLGPALIALAVFEHARGLIARFLVTIGRVPLFFYVLHIAVAHLLAGVTAMALGFGTEVLLSPPWRLPAGWGFSLGAVYGVWICVVFALYPACRWFARLKARRNDWWLSYL
jgi:uncharacterized membrane protein